MPIPNPPTPNIGLIKPIVGGDNNAWGDSLNANLDAIDTAIALASIPTVASAAARDLLFPAPKSNQIARRSDIGVEQRYDQATATWRPEGITRAAGPVISVESRGAVGDGVTDDGAILQNIDNIATAQGYGLLAFDPPTKGVGKTYYINSVRSINNNIKSEYPGGIIELGPNAVLTLNGSVEGGSHQIFKNSGGKIIFAGKQNHFRAIWFGLKGDSNGNHLSGTDNGPTLRWMTDQLPEAAAAHFDLFMKMRVATISGIAGLRQIALVGPFIGGGDVGSATAPTFYDDTPYQSAAMCYFVRCSNCMLTAVNFMTAIGSGATRGANSLTEFDGLKIATTAGLPGGFPTGWRYVNSDTNKIVQYDGAVWQPIADITASRLNNSISTANQFFACQWNGDSSNTLLQALAFSRFSDTNDEYHVITKCGFVNFSIGGTSNCDMVGWEPALDGGASMAAGSHVISFPIGHVTRNSGHAPFFQRFAGERIVIALASGGVFTTTILTIVDQYNGTLTDPAPELITNRYAVIGTNIGDAIFVGPSFNAKAIKMRDCITVGWNVGYRGNGGSFHFFNNSWTANEQDWRCVGNQSEPSTDEKSNVEQSRQHGYLDSEWSFTFTPCRLSSDGALPGTGFIQFAAQSTSVTMLGSNVGVIASPSTNSRSFDFSAAATMYFFMAGCVAFGQNNARMGFTPRHPNCTIEGVGFENWQIGAPGEAAMPRKFLYAGGDEHVRLDFSTGVSSALLFALNANLPSDALLDQGGMMFPFYSDANHRIGWRAKFGDGSFWNFNLTDTRRYRVPMPGGGSAIAPDFTQGTYQEFRMNGSWTIWVPVVTPDDGTPVHYEIFNATGGAIVTGWNAAYRLGAWVDPAAGKSRTISFRYNSTLGQYVEFGRSVVDIP